MKNCAIVCEYNPFHTGHKYQIDELRKQSVDNIFCVMSGPFIQSGLPSFCDKSLRAECAVRGGADAVIELPTVFATASAQIFAEGAVKIISGIKNITHIAMSAFRDRDEILNIAEIKIKHRERFSCELKKEMQTGKSYNAASAVVLSRMYSEIFPGKADISGFFTDPNSILAIEYIAAVDKFSAGIEPVIIKRRGTAFNETAVDGEYISASAIRAADDRNDLDSVRKFIPFEYERIRNFRQKHAADMSIYESMAVFALKSADAAEIATLRNCSEGMEYLLKKNIRTNKLEDLLNSVVGKRYGKKRIYRLLLDIMLGIDKSAVNADFCTRLLACRNGFDISLLPNRVKTNNAEIKKCAELNSGIAGILGIDKKATDLYNVLCRLDGDYYNYSLIKV